MRPSQWECESKTLHQTERTCNSPPAKFHYSFLDAALEPAGNRWSGPRLEVTRTCAVCAMWSWGMGNQAFTLPNLAGLDRDRARTLASNAKPSATRLNSRQSHNFCRVSVKRASLHAPGGPTDHARQEIPSRNTKSPRCRSPGAARISRLSPLSPPSPLPPGPGPPRIQAGRRETTSTRRQKMARRAGNPTRGISLIAIVARWSAKLTDSRPDYAQAVCPQHAIRIDESVTFSPAWRVACPSNPARHGSQK